MEQGDLKDASTETAKKEVVKKSKTKQLLTWMKHNKGKVVAIFLALALIGSIAYFQMKISAIKSDFASEKIEYEHDALVSYQHKVDSITKDNGARLCKVFSWSVRAELMRGNNEQVSILFGQFIKSPGIAKVSLIDPETDVIIIATDRKIEGERFANPHLLINPSKEIIDNQLIIVVSSLNDIIGYLHFEFDNLLNEPIPTIATDSK